MATKLGSIETDDQKSRDYKSHDLQLANIRVYTELPGFKKYMHIPTYTFMYGQTYTFMHFNNEI